MSLNENAKKWKENKNSWQSLKNSWMGGNVNLIKRNLRTIYNMDILNKFINNILVILYGKLFLFI